MWKRLSVFFVLSVLVLSQVLALGSFFTEKLGMDPDTEKEYKILIAEYQATDKAQKAEIASLKQYIATLESQSEELAKDSIEQSKQEESYVSQVNYYKKKVEALQSELTALQREAENSSSLLEIATIDSEEKDKEIQVLETTPVRDPIVPLLGAGATWDPSTGNFGATVDLGLRMNRFSLLVGAEYSPSEWKVVIPSLDDLSFSAGGQVQF